jgi:anti-sigma B factor antagonist
MPASPPFSMVIDARPSEVVLSLHGECDMASAPALTSAIEALVTPKVVVDLSGLTFLDSTGLGGLIRAKNCLAQRGTTMTIRGADGEVRKVLEITGTLDALQGTEGSFPASQEGTFEAEPTAG